MKTNLMVFIAGDNDLDTFGTSDIEEMMSVRDTGENLTILVQQDQSVLARDSGAKRFVIHDGIKEETIHLGETNTGEVSTLLEFIEWGLTEHTADRNIVVLWNHGGGTRDEQYAAYNNNETTIDNISRVRLAPSRMTSTATIRAVNPNPTIGNQGSFFSQELRLKRIEKLMKVYRESRGEPETPLLEVEAKSILFDDESRDFLDNLELKRVFEGVEKKIDIVGFDACLMGMIEVAYQLKDHAKIVVGSEELEPGKGWDYAAIVSYLVNNPTASNEDISKAIVDSFVASYASQSSLKVTLSSIRTDKLEHVACLMDRFAHSILRNETNIRGELLSIVDRTETFDYVNNEQIYRDLSHFVTLTKAHYLNTPEIVSRANDLLAGLSALMIENRTNNCDNAHGLSVYLPLVPNMSGFAIAVFSALEINQAEAAPHWLKLFKQIGNLDEEANNFYGTDALPSCSEMESVDDEVIVEEGFPEADPTIAFTDLVEIPDTVNKGLTNTGNHFMISMLGNPKSSYSRGCDNNNLNAAFGKNIVWGKRAVSMGVSGYHLAVNSLREVLEEAERYYPELVAGLVSDGMLCCRYVRNSHSLISNHSWGTAIDIKVDGVLDAPYNNKVQYGLTLLAPIFNKHGWFWGATFRNEDGMHFEVSKEKILQWEAEGKLSSLGGEQNKPTASTTLRMGDRGPKVLELQKKLNCLGYELIEDGIFGYGSHAVVMDFQTTYGLVSNGIVGKDTMKLLNALLETRTVRTVVEKRPKLEFGMESRWVQVAQGYLNRYGFGLMENGLFEKLMLQAVYDYQESLGLAQTGVVDDELWNRLKNPTRTKAVITRRFPTLTLGDANSEVHQLQSYLRNKGYEVPNDGYLGVSTQKAVKQLQADNGLEPTGTVDEVTRNIIMD